MSQQNYLDGQTWNTVFANKVYRAGVGGVDGQLQIPPTNGGKFLSGIFARWSWLSNKPATTPELWSVRCIVALGMFDPNALGIAAEAQAPGVNAVPNVQDFNGFGGLSQVILDTLLAPITPFQMMFTRPIVIPPNTAITMLMGRPILPDQSEAAAELGQNYFALYGWDEGRQGINVNFR